MPYTLNLDILLKYFPGLSATQISQFEQLGPLYREWNDKINVISRQDIEQLYLRHILHSLAIAKVVNFEPGTQALDVGTGGGFPGIPLAVLFPDTRFHLVDSIGKKITVVQNICTGIGLENVKAEKARAEDIKGPYDYIVSRAVTRLKPFYGWIRKNMKPGLGRGLYYLKGGELEDELKEAGRPHALYSITDYFKEDFFETKKVVYLPS